MPRWTPWLLALAACSPPPQPSPAESGPAAPAHPAKPDAPPPPYVLYEIEGGDCLSVIAERFGVNGGAATLGIINGIADLDRIRAGRDLLIPVTSRTTELPPFARLPTGVPPSEPCPIAVALPVELETRAGCLDAGCTSVAGWEVCACRVDIGEPRRIEVSGRGRAQWTSPGVSGVERLRAAAVDLDGDGRDELVVAMHAVTSMGICIDTTTVAILDEGSSRPTTFTAAGFGFDQGLRAMDGQCGVVVDGFESARQPVLGWGNYFVSRRYLYRDGELRPDLGSPLWGDRVAETPTVQWTREARRRSPPRARLEGRILSATVSPEDAELRGLELAVQVGAQLQRFVLPEPLAPYSAAPTTLERIWRDGRRLPESYQPAQPQRWVGRRVVIETPERGGRSDLELLEGDGL